MITWLVENIATIIISIILISVVVLIIRNMIKAKKNGKSSCNCGCENCAMAGSCHSAKWK